MHRSGAVLIPGWNTSAAIYGTFGNTGTDSQLSSGQAEPVDAVPQDTNPDGTPVGSDVPPAGPEPGAAPSPSGSTTPAASAPAPSTNLCAGMLRHRVPISSGARAADSTAKGICRQLGSPTE